MFRTPLIPETLETPRLVLRMFEEADSEGLFEMFRDEECVRYTLRTPLTSWQAWRVLATYVGHWQLRGYGPYAVMDKSTAAMMGVVGLWFPAEWPEPEIKWSLTRHFWGQGFATEAAAVVRDMAATHLRWKRLISLVLPENERSKAVARRIGGRHENTIPFRDARADIFAYDLGSHAAVP